MPIAVRTITRPDPAVTSSLGTCGVATIHEAQGRTGLMAPRIKPIHSDVSICGPAVTVSVPPGDNWMIHVAVELCQAGDVLVVAPTSECTDGYFGDLLATALQARGVIGLVIDAGCRDVADLRRIGFPVWSRCVSAAGTVKETLGDVNVPIVCGGQLVRPGDAIAADDDGVVVVPREHAENALAAAQARLKAEEASRARYRKGELSLDIYGLRAGLTAKGFEYRD